MICPEHFTQFVETKAEEVKHRWLDLATDLWLGHRLHKPLEGWDTTHQ